MSEKNSEAYVTSKGGLQALTHAMALSYSDENITINCISHGWIHTGNADQLRDIDQQQHPTKRVGLPVDVARACLFLPIPKTTLLLAKNLLFSGGMPRKMIYEH